MKKKLIRFCLFLFLALNTYSVEAQKNVLFPNGMVLDAEGNSIEMTKYLQKEKVYFISLWASWCGPCRMELNEIKNHHKSWAEKYNAEVIALSLDKQNARSRMLQMANSNGWDFTILQDMTGRIGYELGAKSIPLSFIVDQKGEIVYISRGFVPNISKKIDSEFKKLIKK